MTMGATRRREVPIRFRNVLSRRSISSWVDALPGAARGWVRISSVTSSVALNALAHAWISTSNGQRHNSRCRYFKTTEGRLGAPDEGKACKLCGG